MFLGIEVNAALDRSPGLGCMLLIPDLYNACPLRQCLTLPWRFYSHSPLPNSYLNVFVPRSVAVGTGGRGLLPPPPQYFANQKI